MKYLVRKEGWRWASPITATTPEKALRKYLQEPIESEEAAQGSYTVYNDDETHTWCFDVEYHTGRNARHVVKRDGPAH